MRPTILIVDDHADFRRSADAMLEAERFHIVGAAADGAGVMSLLTALRPDIVLLDIQLPDGDGLQVAERLVAGADPPVVVLVSSRDAASFGNRLEESRSRGFIAKWDLSGAALTVVLG